jgi:hypothetical protein
MRPPKVATSAIKRSRNAYLSTYKKGAGATISSLLDGREVKTPKFKPERPPSTGRRGRVQANVPQTSVSFGDTGDQPDDFA